MSKHEVVLVNSSDEQTGTMEKMEAHRKGLLHRAFSVFIFNNAGEMLLQQRAAGKYHGAHLWTNACCSHPYPGEETAAAANRRIKEELGIALPVDKIFDFTYRAEVENDLIEHEFDHVFAGVFEGELAPDPNEVENTRYIALDELEKELELEPSRFTTWFRIAFPRIREWWMLKWPGK